MNSRFLSLISLLSPAERRSAAWLFALMVLAMVLEMTGVGLVVPALTAMIGGPRADSPAALSGWLEWLGNPSPGRLIALGLAALLVVYVVKLAVVALMIWQQHRFTAELQASLSMRLFQTYLRQPWPFHLEHNSALLICNLDKVTMVTEAVGWALVLVAELLVLAGIMAVLFWIEPLGAIAVCVVAVAATLLLDRLTRARLVRWGELFHRYAALRAKSMHQGLHGVKESLIHGADRFLGQFADANAGHARMAAKRSFIAYLPRLWFELVAVAALCLLTATMAAQGKSAKQMIPTLGMFAVAAFRILPSVNRLAAAYHVLRFNQAAIETVREELSLEPEPAAAGAAPAPFRFARDLAVERVSYRYPGSDSDALRGVELRIPAGASVGLVGPSGAGKSTLVDLMLGLLAPTAGRVAVDGIDIASNLPGWQRLVGYVPQSIYLTDDTIRRNVAFGLRDEEIDAAAVARAIRAAQLEPFVASLPKGLDTVVGERGVRLSGGQRQRIGIARALYDDPQVLLLDEATSALDEPTEREVMAAVNLLHGAKTLVIVSHRRSTVADCDTVYTLDSGRVFAAGAPARSIAS